MGKGHSKTEIDWQSVLGPVLGDTRLGGNGLSSGELTALQSAIEQFSPRSIRLHPNCMVAELPFETEAVPWYRSGYWLLNNSCRPGGFLHYGAGDYYIQDAGSMLALALCEIQPGQWVCDTCASPGGKSTGILESLAGSGMLVSNEVIRSRLELLALSLARVGWPNYLVTNLEVESLAELCGDAFDCVVVDAPCTGQSMVARGKQSLAAYSERQIEHSAARQQRIVRAAAGLVKPGGRLVYSTCTFSYAENEAIASWFLQEHPNWQAVEVAELSPWQSPLLAGCYRLWPHRDHCSGAFAAAFQSPEDQLNEPSTVENIMSTNHYSRYSAGRAGSEFRGEMVTVGSGELPWFSFERNCASLGLRSFGDQLHYLNNCIPETWLPTIYAGVPIAEERSGEWSPCYASSVVNVDGISNLGRIDLNDSQASEFLGGSVVRCIEEAEIAWCVVYWRSRPLGWGKLVNGTLKNHLPKALRKPSLRA
jgi:16S rRNA C967 or C1407 C5-methylase (RsmB/RsmF family)/NOL1/NOP2/fmu family ribosome biogenesis protein